MADEFTKAALYGIKTFNKKVKEKIGMEKLIELINEHQKEKHPDGIYLPVVAYRDGIFFSDGDCLSWVIDEIHLISKNYEFIKWLVDNDKIDLGKKLFNLTKNDNRKSIICDLDNNDFSWEDTFLILLSISDTPIEDLISYLK